MQDVQQREQFDGYRLPTEAECEFACRAGTETLYWSGDSNEDVNQVGWTGASSVNRAHPVGELDSNPFGLFDVHGHMWEWAQDHWEPDYYTQFEDRPAVDPWGPATDSPWRVVRGGFWATPEARCRSARRFAQDRFEDYGHNGFRALLSVDGVRKAVESSARTEQR